MSQTLAIFVDQYRALKARKMFWIVLMLSGLVVVAFGAIGIDERGLTLFGFSVGLGGFISTATVTPAYFYKALFSTLGIGFWLSWIAALLALVSTGGIFPDFVSSGAIDLTLSKPISRIRLFLTQYAAGLLFVTLQVAVFCLASFLVLGLRGGVWEPWLFLAVPLVVCFFSYLFAVCALLGVWTRSTVAAILLTLLFWFCLYVLNATDGFLVMQSVQAGDEVSQLRRELARAREFAPVVATDKAESTPPAPGPARPPRPQGDVAQREQQLAEAIARAEGFERWGRIIYRVKTPLPKTGETIALLERAMISAADMPKMAQDDAQQHKGKQISDEFTSRSVAWVLGTSLAFEAVVLSIACFIFCRRDY